MQKLKVQCECEVIVLDPYSYMSDGKQQGVVFSVRERTKLRAARPFGLNLNEVKELIAKLQACVEEIEAE